MGERRLTTKGIVFFGAVTVFLGLLPGADDVVRGEAAQLGVNQSTVSKWLQASKARDPAS
ncbi:MAG: hypothetical protein V3W28_03385 [Thermoplasmata archaeon]